MASLDVLVVGTDERRGALAAALRAAGHRVVESSGGEDGAAALRGMAADALVVDLTLPALDREGLAALLAPDLTLPPESLELVELHHIRRTLAYTGGNRLRAAALLGISRSTLLHKIRRYGL